jgi:anthranilate synthase component I
MELPGGIDSSVSLTKTEFCRLSDESPKPVVIPLSITIHMDGLSPVDLYCDDTFAFTESAGSDSVRSRGFLLESMDREIGAESYSFLGISPVLQISIGPGLRLSGDPRLVSLLQDVSGADAIEVMKSISGTFNYIPSVVPRFSGGFAGYFSYDLVYSLIPGIGPSRHPQDTKSPLAEFMLCTECIVFDHNNNTLSLISNAIISEGQTPGKEYEHRRSALMSRIASIQRCLESLPGLSPGDGAGHGYSSAGFRGDYGTTGGGMPPKSNPVVEPSIPGSGTGSPPHHQAATVSGRKRNEFIRSVKKVKDYIRKGEVVQAVISRREMVPYSGEPVDLYRALRDINPGPYMYFLDFPGHSVVGASPEMLVRVEGKKLTTVPIAGTRRRGATPEEDTKLALDLIRDEKERSEHVMLVDLARNDVGSVCSYGSVDVPGFMEIGRYSHVQHIVSRVTGEIRDGSDRFDGLKACFPAGTVTGAPKVRAMQIIDELEPGPRGLYAGAVGYIGFDNQLEFAIAIRTADVRDGIAAVQAGAGIVADSCPSKEWTETNDKAEAMRSAIRVAGGIA